jgi:hypothetical protein
MPDASSGGSAAATAESRSRRRRDIQPPTGIVHTQIWLRPVTMRGLHRAEPIRATDRFAGVRARLQIRRGGIAGASVPR